MSIISLRKKLCSLALSVVIAGGALCAVTPSAHADDTQQQYLASVDAPRISATNDQLNLPFDPDLYYVYSLLTSPGKQAWDWAIRELLAFDPDKTYDDGVTLTTDKSGGGVLTFDLKKKNITAKAADIKDLNKYLVWNEPRLFILPDWRPTTYALDSDGTTVKTISFSINSNWMAPDVYQNKLVEMESTVNDILANVDARQNDAQRLNALYDRYMAKETYGSYSSAVTGAEAKMTDAFINHKVVCSGYSKGFEYLSMRAGVPAAYMLGYADGGYHAWNAVKLDDNNWYYVDSTWDDVYATRGAGARNWFLKGLSSMNRTLQNGVYSTPPNISQANYSYSDWAAPETVTPMADKAVDQIVAAVKSTFGEQSFLIPQVQKVSVSNPQGQSSAQSLADAIFKNNLQKEIDKLKLPGKATITVSTANGSLSSVDDLVSKGLAVDYQVPGSDQKFGWTNGQFVNKTTNKVESEADVATQVLDMGAKVATRVLESHAAEISDISGLMVNLPETVDYQGATTAEKEAATQIEANLQGKFSGELSIMVMGDYTSINDLLNKGLVVGYKDTDGTYYTLMGGEVVTSRS